VLSILIETLDDWSPLQCNEYIRRGDSVKTGIAPGRFIMAAFRISCIVLGLLTASAVNSAQGKGFPRNGHWVVEDNGWQLELTISASGKNNAELTVVKPGIGHMTVMLCDEPKVDSSGKIDTYCHGIMAKRHLIGRFPDISMFVSEMSPQETIWGSYGGAEFTLPVPVAPKPRVVVASKPPPKKIRRTETTKPQTRRAPQRRISPQKQLTPEKQKRLAELQKKHRHAVAVVVGNSNYSGSVPRVEYAHNDANAMKSYLINSLGYRIGNIIDLRDATQGELMAVFGTERTHEGKLFNYVRPGKSDVTIYYSGHGAPGLKDHRGYLLPANADPNLVEINGYPVDLLYKNLAKIPARSMTVFLDACFSGDSAGGMIVRAASGLSITPKMPKKTANMIVFTAAQGDQFASWDEEAKLGLFTKHLLLALEGAADGDEYGNGDGVILLGEVKAYLDDEMTYQARRRYGRAQKASVQGSDLTIMTSQ
jgi:hypothetical protein